MELKPFQNQTWRDRTKLDLLGMKHPTFPSAATTGQTNFKREPPRLLPHWPHCPIHPVTFWITTQGLWGRFLCMSVLGQDNFHKETSSPSESSRLPLNWLLLGPQPELGSYSVCSFLPLPRLSYRLSFNSALTKETWPIGSKKGNDRKLASLLGYQPAIEGKPLAVLVQDSYEPSGITFNSIPTTMIPVSVMFAEII